MGVTIGPPGLPNGNAHNIQVTWVPSEGKWRITKCSFTLDEKKAECEQPTKVTFNSLVPPQFIESWCIEDVVRKDELFDINMSQSGTLVANAHLHNGFMSNYSMSISAVVSISDEFDNNFVLGDVNGDGAVDFGDVPAFIAVLNSGVYDPAADINGDCVVDFADIPAFIALLTMG